MSLMPHIAVGGFQHETNTFAPHLAHFEDFVKNDSWPGLTRGEALFPTMQGLNIPLTGFIDAAQQQRLYPLLWCSAEPSSYVTQDAFERIADMFIEDLRAADQLDAVYLDLHGAMVVAHFEDGEGELLRRVREIIGPDMPLLVSLDLHANVTEAMVEHATAITVYRTYPHLDMAETGARAFELLQKALAGEKFVGAMRKLPFLIPLSSQCTDHEPCRSIYQRVAESNGEGLYCADFAAGFPPSDIFECGAAVLLYGDNEAVVQKELDDLFAYVSDAEPGFVNELVAPDRAVAQAMQIESDKPVVLADAQDNPGAGGTSDTTGLLEAMVQGQAKSAVLAIMFDPEVADIAHTAGVGARFKTGLGAKSGFTGVSPYVGDFEVEALGDGSFVQTGDMNKNSKAELGPMALLRVIDENSEVRVIVASQRAQCLDLSMIRHLGVEPAEQRILGVKSTVHFRADFDPIACRTIVVNAPGASSCELVKLPYRNLCAGVRLEPMGPEFA